MQRSRREPQPPAFIRSVWNPLFRPHFLAPATTLQVAPAHPWPVASAGAPPTLPPPSSHSFPAVQTPRSPDFAHFAPPRRPATSAALPAAPHALRSARAHGPCTGTGGRNSPVHPRGPAPDRSPALPPSERAARPAPSIQRPQPRGKPPREALAPRQHAPPHALACGPLCGGAGVRRTSQRC